MMKTIKYIFLLLFCMFSLIMHGQELPDKIPTPTASNLGKFGLVPVSMYTGTADISIPIYKMQERGITLDINLKYDTSGLLINQLPGWTGHGWNLMAGGSITRKVNSWEDELELDPKGLCQYKLNNYFKVYDKVPEYINRSKQDPNKKPILTDIYADVFYFNFMGHHGKFWLDSDGEWKVQSDENICIEFDYNDDRNFIYPFIAQKPQTTDKNPKTIKGFTLVTDDGVRYTFGGDISSIEYVTDLAVDFDRDWYYNWTANTWMLTSIDDRFGNNLYKFKYSRGKFLTQLYKTRTGFLTKAEYSSFLSSYSYSIGESINPKYSGSLNSPVYLTDITSASGLTLYFIRKSAFPNSIASHELYPSLYKSEGALVDMSDCFFPQSDKYNALYNPVYFQYYLQCTTDNALKDYQAHRDIDKNIDPFSSMDLELLEKIVVSNKGTIFDCDLNYDMKNRIHLSSVNFTTGSSNQKTYTMKYQSYESIPKDYLTEMVDYWGYYNGYNNSNDSEKKLAPNFSSTMCGMLTQITYPTGGYTKLKYELNSYNKYINADRKSFTTLSRPEFAGGLRVAEIRNLEGGIPKEIKEYKYELAPGKSSGILYSLPQTYCKWTDNYSGDNRVAYRFGTSSIIPLSNSFGPSVGYSCVKEINQDNTYRINTFVDATQVYDDPYEYTIMSCDGANPYNKFSERGYYLGKLSSEAFFNAQGKKIRETTLNYSSDRNFNLNHYTLTLNYGSYAGCCYGNIYKLYYPKVSLIEQTTKELVNNEWFVEKNTYNYEDIENDYCSTQRKHYKTNVRLLTSKSKEIGGDTLKTVYSYPLSGMDYKLANQFCLPAIGTESFLNGKMIKGHKTIYGLCNDQMVPRKEIQYFSNEKDCDVITEYKSYNSKFFPKEIINKEGIDHKLFYNSTNQLVAIVANGSGNIGLFAGTNHAKKLLVSSKEGEIFGDLPTKVDVCTYNSKGLVYNSASGNGVETNYKYDRIGRLTEIRDENDNLIEKYSYNYVSSDSDCSKTENFGIYPCYEQTEVNNFEEIYPSRIRFYNYHSIDSCLVYAYTVNKNAISPKIVVRKKSNGLVIKTIPLSTDKLFGYGRVKCVCGKNEEYEIVLCDNNKPIDTVKLKTSNNKYYSDVVNNFIDKTLAIYTKADESSGNVTTFLNIYKDFSGDFMKTPYVCHGIIRPGKYIESHYSEDYSKWEKGGYSVYIIREDTHNRKLVDVIAYGGSFTIE